MYKKLFNIGILTYIIFIICAVIFYKERVVLLDAANYMFYFTKSGHFYIEHYRYGTALLQILPLIGIRLGLSLNAIILLYSISFSLYYFICYLLCGYAFKDYRLALSLLLFNILFSTHTFFYMVSELPLAITMLIVLLAYIRSKEKFGLWQLFIIIVILTTVYFLHPLTIFPISFILIYAFLNKNVIMTKKSIFIIAALFILIYFIKKKFFTENYDLHSLENLNNISAMFPHYFNIYSNKVFLKNCIDKYYWVPVLSTLICLLYIKTKKWGNLLLFLVTVCGYLLLVNICYPTDYTQQFYIENLYLPIGFFIAIPFVFDVIHRLHEKKLAITLLGIIILTALIRLYTISNIYTTRINWERHFLTAHLNEKLLIKETPQHVKTLLMTWGTPFEFWLLSTTEYGKTASIMINDEPWNMQFVLQTKNEFVTTWGHRFPYSTLPKRYFLFTDTISAYKQIQ
jgi:hypothetical protein